LIAGLLQIGGSVAVAIVGLPLGVAFVSSALCVGRAYDTYESPAEAVIQPAERVSRMAEGSLPKPGAGVASASAL